ncbi:MAG: hypothetical protein Q9208_002779 [Pyrenodesmia sp. 3 TL-2023]
MSQYPNPTYGQSGMTDLDNLFDDEATFSTMELTDDAFSQHLQDFLSNSQVDFAPSTGTQEQTTQSWSSTHQPTTVSAGNTDWHQHAQPLGVQEQSSQQWLSTLYPAAMDTPLADWQQQSPNPYSQYPEPLGSSASWSPSNPYSNPYYQRPSIEASEGTRSGAAPMLDVSASDDQSIQQSTQAAHERPDSNPEPGPYRSKRAIKRAALEAINVDFGNDFRKKGKVEYINGELHVQYRSRMKPAVYHHTLRAEMIAQAPPSRYEHTPKSGKDVLDVTSFHEAHRAWGFANRGMMPDICFQWLPADDRVTKAPGPMMHNGRIVIDTENNPVRDWDIPCCLSSDVEGGRLEAMSRENGNKISKRDFRARMPPKVLKRDGEWKDLMGETALGMRRIRFRDRTALIAHNPREGSSERKKALIQTIPAHVMAQILTTNSVRCWRDTTKAERVYLDSVNAGHHLNKAGSNRLTDEVREDRNVPRDLKLLDFTVVNQVAWPYVDGVDNDVEALAIARESLGLSPISRPLAQDLPNEENGSLRTDLVEAPMDVASTTDYDNEIVSSQDIPSGPQLRRSTSRGKKRSRDEVTGPLESDHPASAKRQRGPAEHGSAFGNRTSPMSYGNQEFMYSGATGPDTMPVLHSTYETTQDGAEPEYSFSGLGTARTMSYTPPPSLDQTQVWDSDSMETVTLSAEEEEYIKWLIASDALLASDVQQDNSEPHAARTSRGSPLLQEEDPEPNLARTPHASPSLHSSSGSVGDSVSSSEVPEVAAHGGQHCREPIIKEEENESGEASVFEMSDAESGRSYPLSFIKKEEDIDEIPDSFSHTKVAWADDGYPTWT